MLVDVLGQVPAEAVTAFGGTVVPTAVPGGLRVLIPVSHLMDLAARPDVQSMEAARLQVGSGAQPASR